MASSSTQSALYASPGAVLGIVASNSDQVIRAMKKGLPYKAIVRLEQQSGLTINEIATAIQLPPRTLARRKESWSLVAGRIGAVVAVSDHI